jgi:TPR repeat protein
MLRAARLALAVTAVVSGLGCASLETTSTERQRCLECALREHSKSADAERGSQRFADRCAAGDAASCSVLGVMHELGRGVPRDELRAADLYQRACIGHNPRGCVNLGRLFRRGAGRRHDDATAAMLFDVACRRAEGEGCFELGQLRYDEGRTQLAREPLDRGCHHGHGRACEALGWLDQHGYGGERDPERARLLFERGCRLGASSACSRLDESKPQQSALR